MDGNEVERKAGPKDGRGKVIPEVSNHDKSVDIGDGYNAEITKVDGLSGYDFEEALVEHVEKFEG